MQVVCINVADVWLLMPTQSIDMLMFLFGSNSGMANVASNITSETVFMLRDYDLLDFLPNKLVQVLVRRHLKIDSSTTEKWQSATVAQLRSSRYPTPL